MVTIEDNEVTGGFGQQAEAMLAENAIFPKKLINVSVQDTFVEHGATEELYARYGMDAESVASRIQESLNK